MIKKKKKRIGLIIFLSLTAVLCIVFLVGWSMLMKEHREAKEVLISNVDIAKISDGIYEGYYAGGMYGLRENQTRLIIEDGRLVNIELIYSKSESQIDVIDELYQKVINEQRINVDTISGATLTSKAHLKAIENALNGSHGQ